MNSHIFRAYDIRGIADQDLDDETIKNIGRAFGSAVRDAGGSRVVLGRDARASSPRIRNALSAGLMEVGVSIADVGLVPTPVTYFAASFYEDVHGLVMITGSHNPPEHNGLKLGVGKMTMGGDDLIELKDRIEQGRIATADSPGTVEIREIMQPYLAYLEENLRMGPHKPRVVIDAGNGTGGLTAMPLLERLGVPTFGLYLDPDGSFPNHEADPTVEENLEHLRQAMREQDAQVGIAYDGDGDRIGVLDEHGNVVWGDKLLLLYAREILQDHPGGVIVGEVKCSKVLYDDIADKGGKPIMWKTGHTLIKAKMKEEGALLGGEMSGHMFFADRYYGFDDACYATGRLLEILTRTGRTISDLLSDLPPTINTPEIRVDCPEEIKFEVVRILQERMAQNHEVSLVDGVRVTYPDGWGLVRASNTQPLLVMRFEAQSQERVDEIRREVEEAVSQVRSELEHQG
ncbi:MAG: phosphomannomutase/phosphoglucomutase [Myxococcota bacterium]